MVLYEKDGKPYFDRVNEAVTHAREWFINVGCKRNVRNKHKISSAVTKELLHCDKWVLKIYVKYGFLHSFIDEGKTYFSYDDIVGFSRDCRLLDENGCLCTKSAEPEV